MDGAFNPDIVLTAYALAADNREWLVKAGHKGSLDFDGCWWWGRCTCGYRGALAANGVDAERDYWSHARQVRKALQSAMVTR